MSATVTGFNDTPFDTHANCYHLGQGHRAYFPGKMRFSSPDRLSPFGLGGLNAYAYCNGDPVNYSDPQGTWRLFKAARKFFKRFWTDSSSGRTTGRGEFDSGKTSHQVDQDLSFDSSLRYREAAVGLALDLKDHEPDLFKRVTKHLGPGDLHYPISASSATGKRLNQVGNEAYKTQLERILNGQERRASLDFLLTNNRSTALFGLRRAMRNAYGPYDEITTIINRTDSYRRRGLEEAQNRITKAKALLNLPSLIYI